MESHTPHNYRQLTDNACAFLVDKMNTASPKSSRVSICVPAYNGAVFLPATLQNILSQDYGDFELIVCDDCSDDRTWQIIENTKDTRLRAYRNSHRLGLVGNWNRCIELAHGEYIYLFHQDDIMGPGDVSMKVKALDDHPEAGFVFSNFVTIDSHDRVIGGHWTPILPNTDVIYKGSQLIQLLMQYGNLIPCPTVLVRRSCYVALGGYDERLTYTPDFEMWLRLLLQYDAAYIAKPLVSIRRHATQETMRFSDERKEISEIEKAIRIFLSEQCKDPQLQTDLAAMALKHLKTWLIVLMKSSIRHSNIQKAVSFWALYMKYFLANTTFFSAPGAT